MKVFISHESALEYWRTCRALPGHGVQQRLRIVLPNNPPTTEKVKLSGLTLPLHIMLRTSSNRWESQTMRQHVYTGTTPTGCFVQAEGELVVSSPEFCFLQMAGQLSLAKLIELGCELCGTYSMPLKDEQGIPGRGFHTRQPLTSYKKLAAFVNSMPGFKGHQKAARALRYLLEGSASPMETKVSLLLTLPYKLGGFGLFQPELNSRIIPSKTAKRSSSKTYYVCDLFWPDYNLAVEYDSDLFHTGSLRIADDSKKRNALALMGVTVITVTKQQLYNSIEFERIARVLAVCMGKRLVYKNPGFATAHLELRNQLL